MNVLLAVDDSSCSREAADSVAARPWPDGTRIRIVTAFEHALITVSPADFGDGAVEFYSRLEQAAKHHAEALVADIAARVRGALQGGVPVDVVAIEGPPRTVILDEAGRWGADLIVVGSHGRRGIARAMLGSVALAVATQAACSVEIVRPKQPAASE